MRKTLQNIHQAKGEAANQAKGPRPMELYFGINVVIKELLRNAYPSSYLFATSLDFQNAEYAASRKSAIAQNLSTCSYI